MRLEVIGATLVTVASALFASTSWALQRPAFFGYAACLAMAVGAVGFAVVWRRQRSRRAEDERRATQRERTRAGQERARKAGKRIGRPPKGVPLTEARRLMKGGASLRETARRLKVAPTTRSRALRGKRKTVPK